MYRVGYRAINKRKRLVWSVVVMAVFIIVLGGLAVAGRQFLRPTTTVKQAAAVVSNVNFNSGSTHTYNEATFSIALPTSWQPVTGQKQPFVSYQWQINNSQYHQSLAVYEDNIPQSLAVNRALAVQANGSKLTTINEVSDNCTDFTKNSPDAGQTGAFAKWQGVSFICDVGNYERDVVGTSSATGINTVTLGTAADTHQFFFTFTDNNINPDFSTFYNALTSFRLK